MQNIAVTKDDELRIFRFGVRCSWIKNFPSCKICWRWDHWESYYDKHQAASHGLCKADVGDLHEDYIRPQKNGSHYDCEYVET